MTSDSRGASLVGILMIVAVLGGLAAISVLGVSSMTDSSDKVTDIISAGTTSSAGPRGSSGAGRIGATAACATSASAAEAASTIFYVNSSGSYPDKWSDLTGGESPNFALPSNVVINRQHPNQLDGNGWKLIMTRNGPSAPTFTCQ